MISPLHPVPSTFADAIPADGLASLARESRRRSLQPGETLMRQGEAADTICVIRSGRVRVERSDPRLAHPIVLAELGPGEVVGEIGAVRGEPRSATVTAVERTEVLEVDLSALAMLVLGFPDVIHRLRRTMRLRGRATRAVLECYS